MSNETAIKTLTECFKDQLNINKTQLELNHAFFKGLEELNERLLRVENK